MTVTDPMAPAFIAGYGPLPSDFNNWIQAPFTFLTSKVVFRAQRQAAQSITASVSTAVAFDTILEDPYSGWDSGTSTWQCPTGCSGWYEITMNAWTNSASNTTTVIGAQVQLNGTVLQSMSSDWAVDGHATGSSGVIATALIGGQDAVAGAIFVNATLNTPTTNGQYPAVEIVWISL